MEPGTAHYSEKSVVTGPTQPRANCYYDSGVLLKTVIFARTRTGRTNPKRYLWALAGWYQPANLILSGKESRTNMKQVPIDRVVHQSEQFKVVSEQQTLASQNLKQSIAAVVGKVSAGRFTSQELQVFLDEDLVGLLGSVTEFMEKTNALRSVWEDGLVLFTDALESQVKANEKLQKQVDLLRIEGSLHSLEPK